MPVKRYAPATLISAGAVLFLVSASNGAVWAFGLGFVFVIAGIYEMRRKTSL
jgi:hypothetical protein